MQFIIIHGSDLLRTEDLGQSVEKVPLDYLSTDIVNKCLQRHLKISAFYLRVVMFFITL